MLKRGQLSIFMIAGLALFLIAVLLVIFKGFQAEFIQITPEKQQSGIYLYTEECLKSTAKQGILFVAANAGYYELPMPSSQIYFYQDHVKMLSKEELGEQLSQYVENELKFCLRNYEDFANHDVEQGEIDVKTIIHDNTIEFNVDFPLIIQEGETKSKVDDFSFTIKSRLGLIFNIIKELIKEQESETICLSCIVDKCKKNNLRVEMFTTNNAIMFSVIDETELINDNHLSYDYLIKLK